MKQYKVTQEFMDELVEWRDKQAVDVTRGYGCFVYADDLAKVPAVVKDWWFYGNLSIERNRRLIAIILWLNGEDVFEVEQSNKFVVRSRKADEDGYYAYVNVSGELTDTTYMIKYATKFDTYAEAQEWANSHQVVIEVGEDGKEV